MKRRSARSVAPAITRILALTIGLVGIVSVLGGMKAAFLDALPFRSPENLVTIGGVSHPGAGDYRELFSGRPTLEGVTQLEFGRATWSVPGGSRRIDVAVADQDALSLLGLSVVQGRGFTRADRVDAETILVSRTFLERSLDDRAGRLGQTLEINGRHCTVIGVAPDAVSRLGPFDVIVPRPLQRGGVRLGRGQGPFSSVTIGRKSPAATLAQVQADMEKLQRSQERPGAGQSTVRVGSLSLALVGSSLPAVQILSFAALVLALLSAVTIAMLAAALSTERLGEFATRSALGASRRQLRIEAMRPWLMAMGPAMALALVLGVPISRWLWSTQPGLGDIATLNTETFIAIFGIGVLLTAAALAGTLIPPELLHRQLESGASNGPASGERLGRWLATAQVALSVALFCSAFVAMQALRDQSSRELGMSPQGVFQIDVHFGEGRSKDEAALAWQQAANTIQAVGTPSSWVSALPWAPVSWWWIGSEQNQKGAMASFTMVDRGFFSTLGIRFVEGSDPFSFGESRDAVVLSATLATSLRVRVGSVIDIDGDPVRVAGIVDDVSDPMLKPGVTAHQIYVAPGFKSQFPLSASVLTHGSMVDAVRLQSSLRAAIPWASFGDPASLDSLLTKRLERERVGTLLLQGYAGLSSLLIVLGLGGVVRRRVARRMQEVGIRLALGASSRQIDEAMMKPVAVPALLGLALGVGLGLEMAQAVAALLPWALPLESEVYVGSAMAGTAIVLVASWPALRSAGRARPSDLLRRL